MRVKKPKVLSNWIEYHDGIIRIDSITSMKKHTKQIDGELEFLIGVVQESSWATIYRCDSEHDRDQVFYNIINKIATK